MKKLKSSFQIFLSHDVDSVHQTPFQALYYWFKEKKAKYFWSMLAKREPYWRFEEMMALEEKYKVRSTFFFLEEKTQFNLFKPVTWRLANDHYSFSDPVVKKLLRNLDRGGWEVGLHGSYYSYHDEELLGMEKINLEKALGHKVIGIRQHHLNLAIPQTWKIQSKLGFRYDNTYGFKRKIGFRGQKFRPFRPLENDFLVIPLVFMDINLLKGDLSGKNLEKLWKECRKVMDQAAKKQALLTVLWHNRFFNDELFPGYTQIYERIIAEGRRRKAEFMTGEQIWHRFQEGKSWQ